ncbi:MAG: TIGR04222 domain-containing membrane protein [Myxococcota bacterium]
MNPIEWLGNMRGPTFLALYAAVFVLLWLVTGFRLKRLDQSMTLGRRKLPAEPDPYELAFLRNGTPEVAQLGLYRMVQRGLITIEGQAPAPPELQAATQTLEHNPLERALESWIKRTQADGAPLSWSQAPELTSTLVEQVGIFTRTLQERLEQEKLIRGSRIQRQARAIVGQTMVLFISLGSFKLAWALMHARYNVLFLVLMGVVGAALLWQRHKLSRLTERGTQYLKDVQETFRAQKRHLSEEIRSFRKAGDTPEENTPAPAGWNPALGMAPVLLMGAYGMSVLPPDELAPLQRLKQQAQAQGQNSGDTGGCGSCSSSSDSGSSCSSGGGCGGCGGGGD